MRSSCAHHALAAVRATGNDRHLDGKAQPPIE
jgi:hypothetical protein